MPILATLALLALLLAGMRLAERLGYPFWYGIGLGVPLINLLVLAWFAFRVSPKEQRIGVLEGELARLRGARLDGPADGRTD
jgi:hypothetical protein